MIRRVVGALAIAQASLVAWQSQTPVFRSSTDVVWLDVSVQDGNKPVVGLGPADFEVRDNDVLQQVTEVSYARLPIDLRLVFDTSGSVAAEQLRAYQTAMTQLTAALLPDDRCDIVAFSARIVDVVVQQHPPVTVSLKRVEPNATSFYDAMLLSLLTAPTIGRRQLTIVMSDGADNTSFFDEPALVDIARRTDAVVYGVTPPQQGPRVNLQLQKRAKDRLDAVASVTGGRVIAGTNDIAEGLLTALDEFRKSYVVAYVATGVPGDGWHTLSVTVRGFKYTVRARQGYQGTGLFSTDSAIQVPEVEPARATSGT